MNREHLVLIEKLKEDMKLMTRNHELLNNKINLIEKNCNGNYINAGEDAVVLLTKFLGCEENNIRKFELTIEKLEEYDFVLKTTTIIMLKKYCADSRLMLHNYRSLIEKLNKALVEAHGEIAINLVIMSILNNNGRE